MLPEEINQFGPPSPTLLICGDFNLPIIKWKQHGLITGGSTEAQIQARKLKEFMNSFFLDQLVMEDTRQNNILDLFLTNNADIVHNIEVQDTVLSDHRLLSLEVNIKTDAGCLIDDNSARNPLSKLNFFHSTVEWDKINQMLGEIDWQTNLTGKKASEIYDLVCHKVTKVCKIFVPAKRPPKKNLIPRDRHTYFRKIREAQKKLKTHITLEKSLELKDKIKNLETSILLSHQEERKKAEEIAVENRYKSKIFLHICQR